MWFWDLQSLRNLESYARTKIYKSKPQKSTKIELGTKIGKNDGGHKRRENEDRLKIEIRIIIINFLIQRGKKCHSRGGTVMAGAILKIGKTKNRIKKMI